MEKFRYESNELTIMENSAIPFAVYQMVDNRVVTIVLSKGLIDLFGFDDPDEAYYMMDNDMYRDTHPDDVARIADAAIRFSTESSEYSVVYRSVIKGSYHVIHSRGKHIYTQTGKRLAVVWYMDEGLYKEDETVSFEDAVEQSVKENRGDARGSYDYLTGLPNMNYFLLLAESVRERYISNDEIPVMLFFDFNGMKNYNLEYGFSEGDELLRSMGRTLAMRFSNENCCRFGGDHFVVFTNDDDLENILYSLFEEIKTLNNGNSLPVRVGIYKNSMGAVGAGVACDRAKMACDGNRNSSESVFCYFSNEMLENIQKQQYILDNIDRAIQEEWIQVYYQPLVRSANGRVCDEEALARWIDPVKGFMSPGDFIPVLENNRVIYKLDLYILEQILKKMKKIQDKGLFVVPSSVNISRSDFESCDIVEEINKRVEASGVSPDMITIEITESVIGGDLEYMKKQVERFHELGFKVWMDDYGSGYSSPEILQSISFDTIKLDMQFMRQFDKGENSRIIINGLIKMAMGLGIETVAEGVETEEQAEFLKEAGCTKLQGFYFCKPIPLDQIFERYNNGSSIGFENPEETGYYSMIGKVNLYSLTLSSGDEEGEDIGNYFDTMPMAVMELKEEELSVIRSNKSFREFIRNIFKVSDIYTKISAKGYDKGPGAFFINSLKQCGEDGRQVIIDEKTKTGKNLHCLIKRVSVNPVTSVKAMQIAILDITDEKENLTYSHVAQALSADYLYIYYVDLENDTFIEYRPNTLKGAMFVERHGDDFFTASQQDAMKLLHKSDRDAFVEAFNKENVVNSIEQNGTFTYTYRLLMDGDPVYVNMKASSIGQDGKHIIIGVNNVDAQMRQKEVLERLKEEKIIYTRINALTGNYIVFYTVNPYNDHYYSFGATFDYTSLGVSKEGEDFFGDTVSGAKKVVFEEDQERFIREFTKENILEKIQQTDYFVLKYRLVINGKPRPVRLKAALVNENGRQHLIIGVSEGEQ